MVSGYPSPIPTSNTPAFEAWGDKLLRTEGKWAWSHRITADDSLDGMEGLLVQISPEGRVLFHNPATGKTTGEEPIIVNSQDIFQLGRLPEGRVKTSRIQKTVENALAYYKETPDGAEASKLADVISAQDLRPDVNNVGQYRKGQFSGTIPKGHL